MNASLTASTAALASASDLRPVQLPAVERLPAYAAAYAWAVVRSWRRPSAHVPAGGFAADFELTDAVHRRWHAFFRTDASRAIPYLFAQSAATMLQRQLLAELGMSPGRVHHLQQITRHERGAESPSRVPQQTVRCRLQGVCRLDDDTLRVTTATQLCGRDGQALAHIEDSFAVQGANNAALHGLCLEHSAAADFAGRLRRTPRLLRTDANLGEWVIGHDWGRRYATLSGELQPQHLGMLTARLLGCGPTTLQSSALRNLLVRQLADVGLLPERLDISFCRPVRLGQRISIVQRDNQFEIANSQGEVIAFGCC